MKTRQLNGFTIEDKDVHYSLPSKSLNFSFNIDKILLPFLLVIVIVYLFILILPVVSIARYSGVENVLNSIKGMENLFAIRLSIITSFITVLITFILGTPTVFYLTSLKNKFIVKFIDIILEIPIVLPPAVAGIGLLLAFGRNSIIGGFLNQHQIDIIFTPYAVIIAQFFISAAFYVRILKNSVEAVPKEIFEAAYICGAGRIQAIIHVILPMLKKSIISGLLLAWIRSLGEFGATMMFAGNILNKTRTMPLQIYTLMQTDIKMAAAFSMVLYIITFSILLIIKGCLEE